VAEEKRSTIQLTVAESTYYLLMTLSSQRGIPIKKICEEAINKWAEDEALRVRKGVEPALVLHRLHQLTLRDISQFEIACEIGRFHINNPTPTSLARFEEACDAAGVSASDVADALEAEGNSNTANIPLTKEEAAYEWLKGRMTPGISYRVSKIFEEGEVLGHKEYALKRVKKDLGVDTFRKDGVWWWILPLIDVSSSKQDSDSSENPL